MPGRRLRQPTSAWQSVLRCEWFSVPNLHPTAVGTPHLQVPVAASLLVFVFGRGGCSGPTSRHVFLDGTGPSSAAPTTSLNITQQALSDLVEIFCATWPRECEPVLAQRHKICWEHSRLRSLVLGGREAVRWCQQVLCGARSHPMSRLAWAPHEMCTCRHTAHCTCLVLLMRCALPSTSICRRHGSCPPGDSRKADLFVPRQYVLIPPLFWTCSQADTFIVFLLGAVRKVPVFESV